MNVTCGIGTWFAAAVAALGLAGCGGGGGGGSAAPGTGTLSVSLTDAACNETFKEVNVTIGKVRVHQSANAGENTAGWTDITLSPAKKVNLLKLQNGVLEQLGQTALQEGHYTQLRLVLEPNGGGALRNSVVLANTTDELPLETPSGVQTGIKVNHQFTVEKDQLVEVTFDFDACRSVVVRGNGTYGLKPVVRAVPKTVAGIVGAVDPAMTGVVVSAQDGNGTVVKETVPNTQGAFVLAPMPPGTYVVVVTAADRATGVITGVTVAAETATRISAADDPIALTQPGAKPAPATGTVLATREVNGTVTPNDSEAALRALQAVNTITIEVAYANADGTLGTYAMPLSRLKPQVVALASPLPHFAATTTDIDGMYTIEASADGYATQTKPANLSGDVADPLGVDFDLVP